MPNIISKCFVDVFNDNNVILLCTFDLNINCYPDCAACTLTDDNRVTAYACRRGNFKIGHQKNGL